MVQLNSRHQPSHINAVVAILCPSRRKSVRAIANLSERKRDVRASIESAPSIELLERAIGCAVDRLEPELAQLRRVLAALQAAIVFKPHQTMRDIVLGRDESIER